MGKNQKTEEAVGFADKILGVQIAELKPYSNNARVHSAEQVLQIANSIQKFGFLIPLLIDGEKNIIAGHGRYAAAVSLGMPEVPCIMATHLTDAERRAFTVADNKIAQNSTWDEELLALELAELEIDGVDLEVLGFNDEELNQLLQEVEVLPEMPQLQSGDKLPYQQITFTLHDQQVEILRSALDAAKEKGLGKTLINENSNGNALAAIAEFYVAQNGISKAD